MLYCKLEHCTQMAQAGGGSYCEYHSWKNPLKRSPFAPEVHTCPDVTCENQTALRYNTGKVDLTLIPTDAAESEARVWYYGGFLKPRPDGTRGYGRNNWQKLWGDDTVNVVLASLLRHAKAIQDGEHRDPETGELHAGHIRCNAAMLIRYALQLESRKKGIA